MRRKNYKITIKIKYETTMLHSGRTAEQAKKDVVKVYKELLKQNKTLNNLFDNPPQIICNAVLYDERR